MTPAQATEVLASLTAPPWPKVDMTRAQEAAWQRHLASLDFDVAMAAVDLIVRSDQWWPTIARFVETADCEARRRSLRRPHELERGERTDDERNAGMAELAKLRKVLVPDLSPAPDDVSDEFWYGGPPVPKPKVDQVWCERSRKGAARRVEVVTVDPNWGGFVTIRTLLTTEGNVPKRPVQTRVRSTLWHRAFALVEPTA